jgi:hypothetical protein
MAESIVGLFYQAYNSSDDDEQDAILSRIPNLLNALEGEANLRVLLNKDDNGDATPLIYAAMFDKAEIVETILSKVDEFPDLKRELLAQTDDRGYIAILNALERAYDFYMMGEAPEEVEAVIPVFIRHNCKLSLADAMKFTDASIDEIRTTWEGLLEEQSGGKKSRRKRKKKRKTRSKL